MIYAHTVEGMQEYNVSMDTIIDDDFVQVPPCDFAVYHQRVYMGRAVKVDVSCVEGEWYVGSLYLDHEADEAT
jgi:hypothetical protein